MQRQSKSLFKQIRLEYSSLQELKALEILQINATIIAGALILLTINSYLGNGEVSKLSKAGVFGMGLTIIGPFSVSSIQALKGKMSAALYFCKWGFYAIIFLVSLLAILSYIDYFTG